MQFQRRERSATRMSGNHLSLNIFTLDARTNDNQAFTVPLFAATRVDRVLCRALLIFRLVQQEQPRTVLPRESPAGAEPRRPATRTVVQGSAPSYR